jgi:hypothetical protein
MTTKTKNTRKPTTGQLINKLERAIALANMRGDVESARMFVKALEVAINSTGMAGFVA